MTRIVAADAGPLIGIARVGHLSILKGLYNSITISPWVFEELNTSSNKPGAKVLSEAISTGWIQIVELKKPIESAILHPLIDAGESESIQLALEQNARLLIIDDKKGRKAAKSREIHVIGTGGILILAKKAGLLEEISQVFNELEFVGYRLSPVLCKRILALANEW